MEKVLPKSIRRCVDFYEHYHSCFHPSVLLIKEISTCYNLWTDLNQIIEESMEATLIEGDENSWIYCGRNDLPDECNKLNDIIDVLHALFTTNYQRSAIFQGYSPQLLWTSLETTFRPQQELSQILMLRKFCKSTQTIVEQLLQKVKEIRQQVLQGKASRRQQDALYKLLGHLRLALLY